MKSITITSLTSKLLNINNRKLEIIKNLIFRPCNTILNKLSTTYKFLIITVETG